MTKDIHINPEDDSTTIVFRASSCCGGGHQTIAGALLGSQEWKRWYDYASKNMLYDVDETQELDMMSDEHFKDFVNFVKNENTQKKILEKITEERSKGYEPQTILENIENYLRFSYPQK